MPGVSRRAWNPRAPGPGIPRTGPGTARSPRTARNSRPGPEPGGSGPWRRSGQELVQVTLLGGGVPLPVAVNPKVVEPLAVNVPL